MGEFLPELITIAIAFGAAVSALVLGVIAFFRTAQLRDAVLEAHRRLQELEGAVEHGAPAASLAPQPASQPPSQPRPMPAPVSEAVRPPPPVIVDTTPLPAKPPTPPKPPRPPLDLKPIRPLAGAALGAAGVALAALLLFMVIRGLVPLSVGLASAGGLGAGLVAIAEWWSRKPPALAANAPHSVRARLPGLACALGVGVGYGAAWLAGVAGAGPDGLSPALTPTASFAALGAVSFASLALALRFGRAMLALGVAGGLAAPALTGWESLPPFGLFGYLLALTAVALATTKARRIPGAVWPAGLGALAWGYGWTLFAFDPRAQGLIGGYFLGVAALGVAFAWAEGDEAAPLLTPKPSTESLIAAHAIVFGAAGGLLLTLTAGGYATPVAAALVLLIAFCAGVAAVRPGFALAALAGIPLSIVAVQFWPDSGAPGPSAALERPAAFFAFAGGIGLAFSVGGAAMMARGRSVNLGAALAALGPPALLMAAYVRAGAVAEPWAWGVAAGLVMAANLLALRTSAFTLGGEAIASAIFVTGAGLALAMAAGIGLSGLWVGAALALGAAGLIYLETRLPAPALTFAATAAAAGALWVLVASTAAFHFTISAIPVANELTIGYGAAGAALWAAARLLEAQGETRRAQLSIGFDAGAIALFAMLAALQVRHLTNSGALNAAYQSLFELGGHTLALLALAGGLAWMFGPRPRPALYWSEAALFGLALLNAAIAGLVWLNPWWGMAPAQADGPPVLNAIAFAFGLPAAAFAGYAMLRRGQGMVERAHVAGAAAMALAALCATLLVRHGAHGRDMDDAAITSAETWAYSAAWAGLAAAFVALGTLRRQPVTRQVGLALAGIVVVKAFWVDIALIGGAWRIVALIALMALLGAAGFGYLRLRGGGRIGGFSLFPKPQAEKP